MSEFASLSVVVVGIGSIGHRHMRNLLTLGVGRVGAVRRRRPNPAFEVPSSVEVYHRLEDALAAGFHAAVVCTPTALHARTALPWIRARVPVLLEKPLAASCQDAQCLVQAEQEHRSGSWMAYCMRFHPAWQLIHRRLRDGTLPAVEYFKLWYESDMTQWHPWEPYRHSYAARADLGGGVLPTLDHEVDLALWCFGQPRRVQGRAFRTWLDADVPDTCWIDWHYATRPQGLVVLSMARRDRVRVAELVTAQGTLQADLIAGWVRWFPGPKGGGGSSGPQTWWHDPHYDWNQMYLELLRAFLRWVQGRGKALVPLQAGWDAWQVCQQVLQAG